MTPGVRNRCVGTVRRVRANRSAPGSEAPVWRIRLRPSGMACIGTGHPGRRSDAAKGLEVHTKAEERRNHERANPLGDRATH